jgi:hypothetical protein
MSKKEQQSIDYTVFIHDIGPNRHIDDIDVVDAITIAAEDATVDTIQREALP